MSITDDTIPVNPFIAEAARLNLPDLPEDATPAQIEQRERQIAEREAQFGQLSQSVIDGEVTLERLRDESDGVWTSELLNALQPESSRYDIGGNFANFFKEIWAMLLPIIAHNGHEAAAGINYEIALERMYLPEEGSTMRQRKPRGLDGQNIHEQFANATNVQTTDIDPAPGLAMDRSRGA